MLNSLQIAVYGAVLSTILLFVKFWELWHDRLKITVSIGWNNLGPDITEVLITSHYKNSVTITWFELYWAKHKYNIPNANDVDLGMETGCLIELPAFSTKSVEFNEQYAFGPREGYGNLYARISIAGRRKPIVIIAYKQP
jgi:hypothetical protein